MPIVCSTENFTNLLTPATLPSERVVDRYAEVPGSGYKQLERVKTSPQTPASSTAPRRDAEPASAGGSDSNGISGNAGAENSEKSPKPSGGGGGGDVVEEGSCDSAAGRETVPTGSSEATSATVEGLEGAAVAAEGKRDGDCSVTGLLPLDDFRNQRCSTGDGDNVFCRGRKKPVKTGNGVCEGGGGSEVTRIGGGEQWKNYQSFWRLHAVTIYRKTFL